MSNSSNTQMALRVWQVVSTPVVIAGLLWWFIVLGWLRNWACIEQMPKPTHWEFIAYQGFLMLMTGAGVPLITSLFVCLGKFHRQPFVAFAIPLILCGVFSGGQGWSLPDLPERLKTVNVVFREPALLRAGGSAGAAILLSLISMVTTRRFLEHAERS